MKTVMIYPSPNSEKGISKYSLDLIKNIKKRGIKMGEITFISGKPFSLFNQLHKSLKYDLIHIQHEYNLLGKLGLPYFFFLGFLWLFRKKIVLTMHTVLSQKENFQGSKIKNISRKIFYRMQNTWIDWTCNKVIVHAKSFKKILQKEYGFEDSKIDVLPHAIIEDIKTLSKDKVKKELGLSGPIYLMIGGMGYLHGHDIIMNQADKIGKTILVVSNPAPINDRNVKRIKGFLELNKQIISRNHFEKFVRFDLGYVPYEKWWKYFAASDLILLPYRGGIGSGIFADAMAMKKPVVASNNKYFKEFSKDYGCLVVAKKNSDFPKVIKNAMKPSNYKKMLEECEKYFKENGLTPISKKYDLLYRSLYL